MGLLCSMRDGEEETLVVFVSEMIFEQNCWTQFWHRWGGTVKFFKLIFIKRFYLLSRADIFWREKKKKHCVLQREDKCILFCWEKTEVTKTYRWEQGFPLSSSMPTVVCEFPLILSHDFFTPSSFLGGNPIMICLFLLYREPATQTSKCLVYVRFTRKVETLGLFKQKGQIFG